MKRLRPPHVGGRKKTLTPYEVKSGDGYSRKHVARIALQPAASVNKSLSAQAFRYLREFTKRAGIGGRIGISSSPYLFQ
ncbi:MAG: hypothetical protein ACRCYU_22835 [Nocardioides sp.]